MTCSVERYASKSGSNRAPTGMSSNLKGQNTFQMDATEDDEFQCMYSNFAYNFLIFNNVHKYHKSGLTTTTTIY